VPAVRFFATIPAGDPRGFYPLFSDRRGASATLNRLLRQLPSAIIDTDFSGARLRGLTDAAPDFRLSAGVAYDSGDGARGGETAAAIENTYVIRGEMDERDIGRASEALEGGVRIWADPQIAVRRCCFGDKPVGTSADVRSLLGVAALGAAGFDGSGVALAVVDDGINLAHLAAKGVSAKLDAGRSTTKPGHPAPGHAPAYHGTMCAYDALLAAPRATLLDIAVLSQSPNLPTLLSDAVVAYQGLLNLMLATPRPYRSLVVSNSWGVLNASWDGYAIGNPLRYIDNPNHAFNILVQSLVRSGADVVFAAGNCGPTCPASTCHGLGPGLAINGANSHPDVLTVGAVDVTGTVAGYSAQGPGALSNAKPDLLGYSHFLGSEALGNGIPDEGTSAAAPVAAGVVAALRSKFPFDQSLPRRQPKQIRGFLLAEANEAGGMQPFAHDVGWGTISAGRFLNTAATAAIA
jgi:subtilisin family serine protease